MSTPRNVSPPLILLATSIAFVMICLDITVVNVAVERIQSALDTSITGLQWVLNGYTLAFASLLLTSGSLSDRFGPKPMMVTGLTLFTLASTACALSGSITLLVAARLVQGVAAALCVPSSLALLNITFSDPASRAKAIGIWAGTASAAMGAGPIIGGLMVDRLGWPSVFLLNIPLGLIGVGLTLRYSPDTVKAARRAFDWAGQTLAVGGLAALTIGCVESGALGWSHPVVVSSFVAFAAITALFIRVESRQAQPMLPLALFRSPTISLTSSIGILLSFGYYGLLFAISVYFQVAKGYAPLAAGLAFLPMTAVLSVTNIGAGALAARYGTRLPLFSGLLLSAVGYFSMSGVSAETPYVFIMLSLVLIGIGMALAVPAINIMQMNGTTPENAGIASGVLNTARQIGGVMGVGVFGSLMGGGADQVISGIQTSLQLSGAGMALGLIIALLCLRPRFRRRTDCGQEVIE